MRARDVAREQKTMIPLGTVKQWHLARIAESINSVIWLPEGDKLLSSARWKLAKAEREARTFSDNHFDAVEVSQPDFAAEHVHIPRADEHSVRFHRVRVGEHELPGLLEPNDHDELAWPSEMWLIRVATDPSLVFL
jgi:hypothetical protein